MIDKVKSMIRTYLKYGMIQLVQELKLFIKIERQSETCQNMTSYLYHCEMNKGVCHFHEAI